MEGVLRVLLLELEELSSMWITCRSGMMAWRAEMSWDMDIVIDGCFLCWQGAASYDISVGAADCRDCSWVPMCYCLLGTLSSLLGIGVVCCSHSVGGLECSQPHILPNLLSSLGVV
jgi:hypothetical protein